MNRFCLVNPLDGRREAPDSKRMESAAMAWREASTPFAALTGADGRTSKRSLLVRPSVSGPVPCSGAPGATGQGAGRSQRRDSRRRQSPGTQTSAACPQNVFVGCPTS